MVGAAGSDRQPLCSKPSRMLNCTIVVLLYLKPVPRQARNKNTNGGRLNSQPQGVTKSVCVRARWNATSSCGHWVCLCVRAKMQLLCVASYQFWESVWELVFTWLRSSWARDRRRYPVTMLRYCLAKRFRDNNNAFFLSRAPLTTTTHRIPNPSQILFCDTVHNVSDKAATALRQNARASYLTLGPWKATFACDRRSCLTRQNTIDRKHPDPAKNATCKNKKCSFRPCLDWEKKTPSIL